ncbi:hypothetical protein UB32_14625 [Mesobacillus subterraneus]|uniref:Uncharacterized protein n=1 Tax=Mesobacillus subterraneus TaxID=285983 RepID=A0A0D6Z7I6_9BACI|nr:hypothetical protein UB32_14625 [Mesobacillus subterraneus]
MVYLRGRVKFPIGGNKVNSLSPRAFVAGFGAIPKPTVKSGWEKMEVLQAFKNCRFERLLSMP